MMVLHPKGDLAEVNVALVDEWNNILRLVRIMRCHCQTVAAANEKNTHN